MKHTKRVLALLCALMMMVTLFPTAFAASGPSAEDLKAIKSQIEYPKSKEYLDEYAYGYIVAPKGHSVYCYGSADAKGSQYTVLDGEEVIVLARRGEMLCVIIPSLERGRWVREKYVEITEGSVDKAARSSGSSYTVKSEGPSEADLKAIKSQIEYPKANEYWDEYGYGTVSAPKGHSVYCYGSADRQGSQYTVLDGEEVIILASRGEMLCVIIPSLSRARWIRDTQVIY